MFTSFLKTCLVQFNASCDLLLEELSKKADGRTEVHMMEMFNKVSLDSISKVPVENVFPMIISLEEDFSSDLVSRKKFKVKNSSVYLYLFTFKVLYTTHVDRLSFVAQAKHFLTGSTMGGQHNSTTHSRRYLYISYYRLLLVWT